MLSSFDQSLVDKRFDAGIGFTQADTCFFRQFTLGDIGVVFQVTQDFSLKRRHGDA